MNPNVPLLPATGKCQRQLRLKPSGKPEICNKPGYVEMDGYRLCHDHFHWQKLAEEAKIDQ